MFQKKLSIENHVSPKPHIWSSHSLTSFPQSWTMKNSLPEMCHQIDQTTMGLWVSQRFSCPKNRFVWKNNTSSCFSIPRLIYIKYIFVSDLYFLFLWFSLGVFQAAVTKMLFSLTNHSNKETNPTPHGVITWLLALTKIRSWFLHLPCHDSREEYSESTSHESLAVRHRASTCDGFWRLLGVTSAQFERWKKQYPNESQKQRNCSN